MRDDLLFIGEDGYDFAGDYLDNDLEIFRIPPLGSSEEPEPVGRVNLYTTVGEMVITEDHVYVSERVVNIVDPSQPFIEGSAFEMLRHLVRVDNLIYTTGYSGGLRVFPMDCADVVAVHDGNDVPPAEHGRLQVHPNPFNPSITIEYRLDRGQDVTVEIQDLAGRRLRVLAQGRQSAGRHEITWNGRDGAGRSLPSGIYLVTLEMEDGVQARKITLVR